MSSERGVSEFHFVEVVADNPMSAVPIPSGDQPIVCIKMVEEPGGDADRYYLAQRGEGGLRIVCYADEDAVRDGMTLASGVDVREYPPFLIEHTIIDEGELLKDMNLSITTFAEFSQKQHD